MKRLINLSLFALVGLVGCTSSSNDCENIEEIMAQRQECESLSKRIKETSSIVLRTNLEEVYEKQCVDIRYYRDSFDDSHICSAKAGEKEVQKAEKALKAEEK